MPGGGGGGAARSVALSLATSELLPVVKENGNPSDARLRCEEYFPIISQIDEEGNGMWKKTSKMLLLHAKTPASAT